LDARIRKLHEQHGHTIRFSPNHLSTINTSTLKDTYGYGKNNLVKDPTVHAIIGKGQKELGIIQAGNEEHARIRRQLAHAFSERALRDQESLIQGYVDTLIAQLGQVAATGEEVDVMRRYMYTTSDITSTLAFGTSFDTLHDEGARNLVHILDKFGPFITRMRLLKRLPLLAPVIALFFDKQTVNMMTETRQWATQVLNRRLEQGVMEEKKDFLSYVLKHKDEDVAMTDTEMCETSRTMILAGAETTRTVLSAVTYYLLKHPRAMERVTSEVREAFTSEDDIDFIDASNRLPYMLACLEEAMRLHPPVPGAIMARKTPLDRTHVVAGEVLPPGTTIVFHPLAALTCSRNFYDPLSFRPERWLPEKDSKFSNDDHTAFQPFSWGPRNCIGKNLAYSKMRIVLARVLWNYDFTLCSESAGWDQQKIISFWQIKPLWVTVRKRDRDVSSAEKQE
jgi:cytochrome P450